MLVGAAATAAVVITTPRHAPPARHDASGAYIEAWRHSQLSTWKVVLRWTRTVRGARLQDDITIAQRPPDRLSTGGGSVDARTGDRRLACTAGSDGRLRCRDAGPAPPYSEEVDNGAAVLRQQLSGPGRLYDVTSGGPRCYDLRLRLRYPAPPYGQRSRFCFDARTGAPTLRDVERLEGRDVQEAVSLSADVTVADLTPPA